MGSASRKTFLPLEPTSFTNESKAVIDFIADYYKNIEEYPVQSSVEPGYLSAKLPNSAPYCPESLEDILKDVNDCIIPGLTHWQSPNFFAYFQANASTAGFLGEMLCSGFNVVGFNWISSPAATELESIVLDWMGKLLKLPSSFLFSGTGGGVLHGSTCEAAVCTLAAARDKALKELGGWENITKLMVYASDQTHFTFQKAAKLVGIPPSNFRFIETSLSTGFSMSSDQVRLAIEHDIKSGLVPLFLCATIGTTACGAIDPIAELGKVARKYKLWLHIDAAYAGSACICPELRHCLDGVELANSFSMNPHKCDISMAKRFAAFVAEDDRFEIVVPRKLKPKQELEGAELNCKLLEAINSSGRAFMTHAVVDGIYVIRCAIGTTMTEERHVDALWKLIQENAQCLLME
ncbi:Pyridoxal phosphate-dependent decarboxylase - like 10 [Theobroma cacao]|nr:Pyridoxal phosphate-dependent decarboxylase - like 10 [Theobroma cacao]